MICIDLVVFYSGVNLKFMIIGLTVYNYQDHQENQRRKRLNMNIVSPTRSVMPQLAMLSTTLLNCQHPNTQSLSAGFWRRPIKVKDVASGTIRIEANKWQVKLKQSQSNNLEKQKLRRFSSPHFWTSDLVLICFVLMFHWCFIQLKPKNMKLVWVFRPFLKILKPPPKKNTFYDHACLRGGGGPPVTSHHLTSPPPPFTRQYVSKIV